MFRQFKKAMSILVDLLTGESKNPYLVEDITSDVFLNNEYVGSLTPVDFDTVIESDNHIEYCEKEQVECNSHCCSGSTTSEEYEMDSEDCEMEFDIEDVWESDTSSDVSSCVVEEFVALSDSEKSNSNDTDVNYTEKKCRRCRLVYGFSYFNKDKSSADGLQSWCIKCHKYNKRQLRRSNSRKFYKV